jgi:tRNA A-37 threonylcarbamoyl transferase component Bud32
MTRSDLHRDYLRIREAEWTGYLHPDFEQVPTSCLIDPEHYDERRGPVEKVQSSDTAEVYRYAIQLQHGKSELLYLKRYPYRSQTDVVISLFRPSRAKRAFGAGLMLEKHGIDTPQIAAFLQKKDGLFCTEDILITRAMTDAIALGEVLRLNRTNRGTMTTRDRRGMIAEFGNLVGRMHAMGICHGDLRWGNIFVSQQRSGWTFYLIDNERTRKYPILPFWLRRKNLVQLYIDRGSLTRTEQMRFWQAYIETAGISSARSKRIARAVFRRTEKRLKKRSLTHTGLQSDKAQSHWNVQSAHWGDCKGFLVTEFCQGDRAAAFLRQIEALTETGTILKDDRAARLVRCTYNHWDIVIKRYNHQGLWHSLRYTIKGSRARKCWRFGHLMTALDIPCAAPVGVVEQRKFGLLWQSYIINVFIEGPDIRTYLQPDLPEAEKHAVLSKMQKLAAQLVKNNLIHNDFKHSNLLIQNDSPVLIDLDSMRRHKNRWILSLYKRKMDRKIRKRINDGSSVL